MVTLEEAIEGLYHKVVVEGKPTSTTRLRPLAEYAVGQLATRGLEGAQPEVKVRGWVRQKDWDVVLKVADRVRLAISLKSMLSNLPGSVPNRIDDLIGEAANVQMHYPEIVIGYIMVMDESADDPPGPEGKWVSGFEEQLGKMTGRRAPFWTQGTIEAGLVIRVNLEGGAVCRTPEPELARFFDQLALEFRDRS